MLLKGILLYYSAEKLHFDHNLLLFPNLLFLFTTWNQLIFRILSRKIEVKYTDEMTEMADH